MSVEILDYEAAYKWVDGTPAKTKPHLLLGNGFSVAYDKDRFSYGALLEHARDHHRVSSVAESFFARFNTCDFEVVIRKMMDAATTLEVLDASRYAAEIGALRKESDALKELLATTLAELHPERPNRISDEAYSRVVDFINPHSKVFTANYDLLLYWALMRAGELGGFVASDDGFRGLEQGAEYVIWDYLNPHNQTIYYLHGALHLYRDVANAQLQKLTWVRTDVALVDQIRYQLSRNNFPLIVTEGTSADKLAKIQTSDYLSKGLRSLAAVGGGLLAYGLSFGENDAHITSAIVRSNIKRVAVSIFGDASSSANQQTVKAANRLVSDRKSVKSTVSLDVAFYDAESANLWK